jgi:hypothetical protein
MAKETKSVKKNQAGNCSDAHEPEGTASSERSTPHPKASGCKEFELDLTDYVMGETTFLTKEKQSALFEHLRKCDQCRSELWNWKEVLAVMKTKGEMSSPEHQKKIGELIKRLHEETDKMPCQLIKDGTVIPNSVEVGAQAKVVWNCVGVNGVVNLVDLPKLTNLPYDQAYGAYGWLALQEKIVIVKNDEQNKFICLTEAERQNFQQVQLAQAQA